MKRRSTPAPSPTNSSPVSALNSETPAQVTPFPYEDYVRARHALMTALRGPRFYATLIGASGMGKTSLLRELSASLEPHRQSVIYLSSSRLSAIGVANFLARTLHITPRRSYLETVDVVTESIAAQTSHLLLWIDEADQVDCDLLQEMRMLAESECAAEQLFSVVLSGLPALIAKIDTPVLFPLKRRIRERWILSGLLKDELDAFLVHRFGSAQAKRILASGRDDLFERTQATPALIENVVRHALAKTEGNIDAESVRAVLDVTGL